MTVRVDCGVGNGVVVDVDVDVGGCHVSGLGPQKRWLMSRDRSAAVDANQIIIFASDQNFDASSSLEMKFQVGERPTEKSPFLVF